MRTIENTILPPKGYKAITLGPFIFIKKGTVLSYRDINHEAIHWEQQKEMIIIPFFLWYVVEFIIKYIYYGFNWHKAYRSISFEREAYSNQETMTYLNVREPFAWINYIKM